ncbi:sulfurtransferase TusA family protein [Phosphitispora fastidiosa]|uniref:sulfurtransferase TusA family protein n=1 Tax=Phosphitispora fastidiosa TaxID=2837202 RepID=UPI001E4B5DDE|nr:sulfurtransferase TusA family protein [Phosphitispora fastidiosa]MBU7006820.1 TusA-related sulfurtransferase [Phosphitispora fastidiosa]
MQIVDVRGISCPEPVLRAKKVLDKGGPGPVKVLVDEEAAGENVTALARHMGWNVARGKHSDYIEILLSR